MAKDKKPSVRRDAKSGKFTKTTTEKRSPSAGSEKKPKTQARDVVKQRDKKKKGDGWPT